MNYPEVAVIKYDFNMLYDYYGHRYYENRELINE
jgi:hypothetical protein